MSEVSRPAKSFTPKQGQYLAYIYAYTRLTAVVRVPKCGPAALA